MFYSNFYTKASLGNSAEKPRCDRVNYNTINSTLVWAMNFLRSGLIMLQQKYDTNEHVQSSIYISLISRLTLQIVDCFVGEEERNTGHLIA